MSSTLLPGIAPLILHTDRRERPERPETSPRPGTDAERKDRVPPEAATPVVDSGASESKGGFEREARQAIDEYASGQVLPAAGNAGAPVVLDQTALEVRASEVAPALFGASVEALAASAPAPSVAETTAVVEAKPVAEPTAVAEAKAVAWAAVETKSGLSVEPAAASPASPPEGEAKAAPASGVASAPGSSADASLGWSESAPSASGEGVVSTAPVPAPVVSATAAPPVSDGSLPAVSSTATVQVQTPVPPPNHIPVVVDPPEPTGPQPIEFGVTAYGAGPYSLIDPVKITGEGFTSTRIGFRPYTRGYLPVTEGALRFRHGSKVPESSVLDAGAREALQQQPPGKGLDAMAQVMKADTAFEAMANSKEFYDPQDPRYWWGKCHAWAFASLHPELSKWVDVDGPEGERGRWFAGQWLSRADLGSWVTGVSDVFAKLAAEETNAQTVSKPNAIEVLRAFEATRKGGPGFIADVHNDQAKGTAEVWNQPFFGANLEVKSLAADQVAALIDLAKADGWNGVNRATDVKLVRMRAFFGKESADSGTAEGHEGNPVAFYRVWPMYVLTDAEGIAVYALEARDPRLASVPGLPMYQSDPLPDYLATMPTTAVDDAIHGRFASYYEKVLYTKEFRFLLGTVLPNSVPGTVRRDFEKELAALPAGAIAPDVAAKLKERFGAVANAYSPEQWAQHFASRGLEAEAFGAVWAKPATPPN